MNAILAIIFIVLYYLISYPMAKNFQLCGYDIKHFFKHFFAFSFSFLGKNKLIFTHRMIRLAVLYFVVLVGITLFYFLLIVNFWWIIFCIFAELVLLPVLFMLSAAIISPIENFIKKGYINKARRKLHSFSGKKIAITGSFGKTTTKNFLVQILQRKYKVCATPKNYNTPMGLCKTVLEELKNDDEILIVEMGARRKGDIAELMRMLQPSYGILTAIGQQHLESFGDVQTIVATKNELCEHMCNGGVIVFDCANELTKALYDRYPKSKLAANIEGGVRFDDVKYMSSGCECKIIIDNDSCMLKLGVIGSETLKDLACAVAMSLKLGTTKDELLDILPHLKPAAHRLELIPGKFATVIDDSYNSNMSGAMQACECVQLFDGKRIIISPGFVEQGDKQYELNFKLGKLIGLSCDEFILMNEVNKNALFEGAVAAGLKQDKIHFAHNAKQREELIKELQTCGCVILFENDLPDNYK